MAGDLHALLRRAGISGVAGMTRERIIVELNTLSIRLSALGLRLDSEGVQAIRSAIEVLEKDDKQPPKPTVPSQVWLITARSGQESWEIPMLFNGNLRSATDAAINYVHGKIPGHYVDSVRRIGVSVEVPQ